MQVPTTYYLETFGCQMNVLDSQLVAGQMRGLGLTPVASPGVADIVLFVTCSVRQHAEDKVLSRLGGLRRLKQRRPEVVIGVLGCMAERQREELFTRVPHLDLLCGPGELYRLPALLRQVAESGGPVAALAESLSRRTAVLDRAAEADPLEAFDLARGVEPGASVVQSYVRVQRGCDKFCTYCVVPFVRGPERSRPAVNVAAEARRLVERGCREITLLGQTVNSYSYPEAGGVVGLAGLLERVAAIEGLDRVRFVTSYPADFDEDIFRVMRDVPQVCPYLHVPAQSGSDRMLKAMKRGYTVAEYLRLMDTARRYLPGIALAGDFIVGFCGETEEDFRATVELVRRVQYKSLFVFKYSPRPGTSADRAQADDVPQEVKVRRNNELLAVQNEIGLAQKRALVGRTVEVLVEGYSKSAQRLRTTEVQPPRLQEGGGSPRESWADSGSGSEPGDLGAVVSDDPDEGLASGIQAGPNQLVGRTPHDLIAVFDGDAGHIGRLVKVRVESVSPLTLFGRIEA